MALFFLSDKIFTPPPFSGLIYKIRQKVRSDLFYQKHLLFASLWSLAGGHIVHTPADSRGVGRVRGVVAVVMG